VERERVQQRHREPGLSRDQECLPHTLPFPNTAGYCLLRHLSSTHDVSDWPQLPLSFIHDAGDWPLRPLSYLHDAGYCFLRSLSGAASRVLAARLRGPAGVLYPAGPLNDGGTIFY
jgi:hypothetical protein